MEILFDKDTTFVIINTMDNVESVFSKNLIKYRTLMGLRQSDLAKKINYSDKSISKWERGEGLPDLKATIKLCGVFGISIDDMLKEHQEHNESISQTIALKNKKHILTSLLSASLVWFIATVIYIALFIAKVPGNIWITFIYAIPISSIVLLVFSCIWGTNSLQAICVSLILWGFIFSIASSIKTDLIWFICIIGAAFQVMTILWFALRKLHSRKNLK